MIEIRLSTPVAAPPERVFDLARSIDLHSHTFRLPGDLFAEDDRQQIPCEADPHAVATTMDAIIGRSLRSSAAFGR